MDEFFLTDKGQAYLGDLRNRYMEANTLGSVDLMEDLVILGWIDTGYITSLEEGESKSNVPPGRLRQAYRRLFEAGYIDG